MALNKLPLPKVKDLTLLKSISQNKRLNSYPELGKSATALRASYARYRLKKGDAHSIDAAVLPDDVKGYLKGHYTSPPKDLTHLARLRSESADANCPMCGSMHSGTLDHVLPKDDYPEFAILSLNLAPACQCNSKRGTVFKGGAGERVLHPYYDDCLGERLLRADFTDLGDLPSIDLALMITPAHPNFAAVSFHVEHIVRRTAIINYLRRRWNALCAKPSTVIRDLRIKPASVFELISCLELERETLDECHGGRNNWNSVFVSGLIDPNVAAWLFDRLSDPQRVANGPLL